MYRKSEKIKSQSEEIREKNVDEIKNRRFRGVITKIESVKTATTITAVDVMENVILKTEKGKQCKKCRKINHFVLASRTNTNRIYTGNEEKEYLLGKISETDLNET